MDIRNIPTFGAVAAEDEPILNYFVETDAVREIAEGDKYLVLGRKGSGKTALFRYFNEKLQDNIVSIALNLRGYPWAMHAKRADTDVDESERYEASWRYLIVLEFARVVAERLTGTTKWTPEAKNLLEFFKQNYGGINVSLGDFLRPPKLSLSKASFEPQLLGAKLGGITLERGAKEGGLARELNLLTDLILETATYLCKREGVDKVLIHFDELDQGMAKFDRPRQQMLTGLILASRAVNRAAAQNSVKLKSVIYLRTDLWNGINFSDKNKITTSATLDISWNEASLLSVVNSRVASLGNITWDNLHDEALMRGRQRKFSYIVARSFLRPRDIISFLNILLAKAKERINARGGQTVFTNKDIVEARREYSTYLRAELQDEIAPHWPEWEDTLKTISKIGILSFARQTFSSYYPVAASATNTRSADEALETLYEYSVLGAYRSSGYGGKKWVFRYSEPGEAWDSSGGLFKVHLGLKEHLALKEN
ncbi:hypothetical protein G7011_02780 [Pseudomonas plecoglossicida]|uniref:P-loop ATPase, Sll1717 family n=1 Tax=Pseudomonas plecoglossicida TaxID=70775 RepID=UPI0015E44ADA|nr:hypothetical protein [Pseudomonas plecoglossicida]MBA1196026.1 hypothetical protein [Pseudomonas plecoglossicida]